MFKINYKGAMFFLSLLIISLVTSYILSARYFPIEPDAANSPLVWRAFLDEGFFAFKDWVPTADSWYFTVYPVNFLFFFLTGNDGELPLILSSSLFVGMTAFIFSSIIFSITKSYHALFVLLTLTLLPAYVYIFGYAAHPFSHYSTNCFGAIVLALSYLNLKKRSLLLAIVTCIIATFSSVSDPWFQATYFLPLLITSIYFTRKKIIPAKITLTLSIGFILSLTNLALLQRLFGLPIQRFKLVSIEQWLPNAEQIIHNLGSSLNLFFISNNVTSSLSLLIWTTLFLYSFFVCIKKGNNSIFIALFSFLSVAGIISSFIISFNSPSGDIGARFFVNAVCFTITLTALGLYFIKKPLLLIIFPLYLASSLYSYTEYKSSPISQENQTKEYISFLDSHNLHSGYSDYWQMANNVNWLSFGRIHITPIMFDDEKKHIVFDRARPQTMKSWLAPTQVNQSKERQFFVIPLIETETPLDIQIESVKKQIGIPDETVTFQNMTIFIYNHGISSYPQKMPSIP